ncbi:MAG TPA: aminotransferase class I/II-fold pyridoxal phosphate-dependent enzyme [Pseudolabrys sp.]|nr:aminotransferase class I/II-fold pyridoxal phosphate-dependent enzyme [Pseudolabrys sp.]
MHSLDAFAQDKLDDLDRRHLRRAMTETLREDGIFVERGGRRLLSFSCNDYLNLTQHPAVKAAAAEALAQYGAGSGASRLVTGNHPLYAALESRLAAIKHAEAAVVFGSGYLANAGIIPVLIGEDGLIVIDELAHACLYAGAQLSRGKIVTFRHNHPIHARELLETHRAAHDRALIVTDGVFSMDGDLAPLEDLLALGDQYDAWLMSDDAHGLGVVGGGRGSSFAGNAHVPVPLQMGTLSKAIGAYGGYLCASAPVIELMRNRARTLVYSTGLPPAIVAGAIAALDLIEREPDYAALPVTKAKAFTRAAGLPEAQSPIVPVLIGSEDDALDASEMLAGEGFLAAAIRPPTVPAGTARLRLTFTALHPDEEIARLARLVRERILA